MANNEKKNRIKIPEDVREFAKATLKKYKKHNDGFYESKKELKQAYNLYLIDMLPRTIEFIVKFGYIQRDEVPEIKEAVYAKLVDEEFIKTLKKELKKGNKIKNIKLLPIIIKDILQIAEAQNAQLLAEDPNAKIFDMTDLVELSQLILKKRLKKMSKAGIDDAIAFDVLSVIPTTDALANSMNYRINLFFKALYEHSKSKVIPFEKIMEIIVDDEWYGAFIAFALLERKEVFGRLTENQKNFYLAVSNWCFSTMEQLNKNVINTILERFVKARQADERNPKGNRDTNRRYALASLSETDYPRIYKAVQKMISMDDSLKKYFN